MLYALRKEARYSIIVPCFNQVISTRQCVDAVLRCTSQADTPFEVIIVDNGSYDGTSSYIQDCCAKNRNIVKGVTLFANMGFSHACNKGAEQAKGKYLVFLHNDSFVTPGWLSSLIEPLSEKTTGILGPKLVYPQTRTVYSAGYVCSAHLGTFYPLYQTFDPAFAGVNKTRGFQALHSACLLIEKDLFIKLGWFANYALEDIDLCLKARKAGKEVIYNPRACVYHYGLLTLNGMKPEERPELDTDGFLKQWWDDRFTPDDEQYYYEDGFRVYLDENGKIALRQVIGESCDLTHRGMKALDDGCVEHGEQMLLDAVLTWPGNLDAWLGLCMLRMAQDRFLEALYFCDQGLRTQPQSEEAKILKGKILLLYGNRNLAAKVLDPVMKREEAQDMLRTLNRKIEVCAGE